MSENNFAITEQPLKEEEAEEEYIPLTHPRFVRQRSGMKAVRQRKRKERRAMNRVLHANRGARKSMKKVGVTDQIQRGFEMAKRWREE